MTSSRSATNVDQAWKKKIIRKRSKRDEASKHGKPLSSSESVDGGAAEAATILSGKNEHAKGGRKKRKHRDDDDEPGRALAVAVLPRPAEMQFVDDLTGRKPIHPSALRYALKLLEKEAQVAIKSISESLLEKGELEEHRKVQVRSAAHTSEIIERVRNRLLTVRIPARYIRIDDVALDSLDSANQKRREETERLKAEIKRLEDQNKIYKTQHQQAFLARDEMLKRKSIEALAFDPVNPLLANALGENPKADADVAMRSDSSWVALKQPAKKANVLSVLLNQLPSEYD